MPLNDIDYSKTIIYKIQHIEKPELVYVGHTTNFTSRKSQHKKSLAKGTSDIYNCIRKNGGWECFEMYPIKQVSCKNRIEALIEEQKTIDELKAVLNKNKAYKQCVSDEEKERNKERREELCAIKHQQKLDEIEKSRKEEIEKFKQNEKVYVEAYQDKIEKIKQKEEYFLNKKKLIREQLQLKFLKKQKQPV